MIGFDPDGKKQSHSLTISGAPSGAPDLFRPRACPAALTSLHNHNTHQRTVRSEGWRVVVCVAKAYVTATAPSGTMTFEDGTERHDDHVARAQDGGKPLLIRARGAVEAIRCKTDLHPMYFLFSKGFPNGHFSKGRASVFK